MIWLYCFKQNARQLITHAMYVKTSYHTNSVSYVQGATLILFVDSEAVECALVKGFTKCSDTPLLVGKFWELAQELNAAIYIDRVPTDANCSDGPSRDKVYIGKQLGWLEVQARWPSAWGSV